MPAKVKRSSNRRRGKKYTGGFSPVPTAYRTRMAYHDHQLLSESAAGTGAWYSYRLNDLFDPNLTGIGTQPVSYDEWCQMYKRLRVCKVMMDVGISNATATGVVCGIIISPTSTLPSNPDSWPCQRFAQHCLLGFSTGMGRTRFKTTVPLWDAFGITKDQYMDEIEYSHVATSGPIRSAYLHVFVFGVAATIGIVNTSVLLHYDVELSELLALNVS